jgi:hypothetical protein
MRQHPKKQLSLTLEILDQEGDKIILEPITEIPAREVWLYQNPTVLASVLEGLKQAEDKRVSELDIDYLEFLKDEEDV